MAQQIGRILPLAKPDEARTVSCPRSEKSLIESLMSLDLSLPEAFQLRDLALAEPRDREQPASPEQIARHLQFIAATLPSRNVDDETGKQRFAVYVRMLSGYGNDALAFMSQEVLRDHDWFPTPRQCLAALSRYTPSPSLRERALDHASALIHAKFEDWRDALLDGPVRQAATDEVPDKWRRIAFEQGLLRFDAEAGYTQRLPKREIAA